jgi:hypothetical protein
MAGILLLTACTGSVDLGPTSTPDPLLMTIEERTIWDFENFRNEVIALAGLAADTPVEDLEPILQQMQTLNGELNVYESPLFAAQAHSALLNFFWSTEQCYMGKFAAYLTETSGQGMMGRPDDSCERAQVFLEAFDLYLQELKETDAAE